MDKRHSSRAFASSGSVKTFNSPLVSSLGSGTSFSAFMERAVPRSTPARFSVRNLLGEARTHRGRPYFARGPLGGRGAARTNALSDKSSQGKTSDGRPPSSSPSLPSGTATDAPLSGLRATTPEEEISLLAAGGVPTAVAPPSLVQNATAAQSATAAESLAVHGLSDTAPPPLPLDHTLVGEAGGQVQVVRAEEPRYRPVHTFATPDHHPCTVLMTDAAAQPPRSPQDFASRRYSLWHDDMTGNRTLWVGPRFEPKKGFYAGVMRDEVYAVWHVPGEDLRGAELHVHCSVTSSSLGEGPYYERLLAALGSDRLRDPRERGLPATTPCPYERPHDFWVHFSEYQRAVRRGPSALAQVVAGLARPQLTWHIILRELEDAMALFRKKIFEYHMPEALYALGLGDPHLQDIGLGGAPVFVHYHARPGQSSQARLVRLGTVAECAAACIKRNGGGEKEKENEDKKKEEVAAGIPSLRASLRQASLARQEVDKVWADAMHDIGGIMERCFFASTAGLKRLLREVETAGAAAALLASSALGSVTASLESLGSVDEEDEEGEEENEAPRQRARASASAASAASPSEDDDDDSVIYSPLGSALALLSPEIAVGLMLTWSTVWTSDFAAGRTITTLLVTALIPTLTPGM